MNKLRVGLAIIGVAAILFACGSMALYFAASTVHGAKATAAKPTVTTTATDEQQAERLAIIDSYKSLGLIVGQRLTGNTPHIVVDSGKFGAMDFKDKQQLAGVLAAFHYRMPSVPSRGSAFSAREMVVFHDSKTERRIASFTPMGGLKIH